MTGPLLLDEMFHPRIAAELTALGHRCTAVAADPALRSRDDVDLLVHALTEGATLVTNNVVDFEILRRERVAADQPIPPLIYPSDSSFPRDRRFIGRLVSALDEAIRLDAVTRAGGVLWLAPTESGPGSS